MSKYRVIELGDKTEYVMEIGTDSKGRAMMVTVSADDLEELNSDYINEHYGRLQDDAYQRGFEDGKEVNGKGCKGCRYEHQVVTMPPCNTCCNIYANHWTAKQTDDEIKVGDEVADKDGDKTIVTNIHGELFDGLCSDGSTMTDLFLDDNRKTGRHFDISSILKEMQS